MTHLSKPAAPPRTVATIRPWHILVLVALAVLAATVFGTASSDDTDPLPACRLAYLVDHDTMVVPQLDSDGFVVGYDTQQCEPAR